MTRVDLLNAIAEAEKLRGVHGKHITNSRRLYLLKDYPSEVICMVRLAAYLAHLEAVIKADIAVQMVVDALTDVTLGDDAKREIRKLIGVK